MAWTQVINLKTVLMLLLKNIRIIQALKRLMKKYHLYLGSVLKTICKPDIQKKFSNLDSKKARTCGNILRKCVRIPQILMYIISLMIQHLKFVARTQTLQVLNQRNILSLPLNRLKKIICKWIQVNVIFLFRKEKFKHLWAKIDSTVENQSRQNFRYNHR